MIFREARTGGGGAPRRAVRGAMTEAVSEPAYAWFRLGVSVLISAIGGVGLWSIAVVMPTVEAEFGVARADASLPFLLLMIGFAAGGVLMGRLTDRFGLSVPLWIGAVALGAGYALASRSTTLWQFALVHGVLVGFLGSSATFGPVIADVSRWFTRHRGIAVGIASCGSYLAGTIWPPVIQHFVETAGWRATHLGIGLFCLVTIPPLALLLRRKAPAIVASRRPRAVRPADLNGLTPGLLQGLLVVAGLTCCIAMAMPQVHIVSLCADLGYGTARGAEMLSVMLAAGVGEPPRLRLAGRPHRPAADARHHLGAAGAVAAPVPAVRIRSRRCSWCRRSSGSPRAASCRPMPRSSGAYYPAGEAGTRIGTGARGDAGRHGARRLDVGRHLRPHAVLRLRLPQRLLLEPGQPRDRGAAARAARPAAAPLVLRPAS